MLPSAFNKTCAALYLVLCNKKRAFSKIVLTKEDFSGRDFVYLLVPLAYRKEEESLLRVHEKEDGSFSTDQTGPSNFTRKKERSVYPSVGKK